MNTMYKQLYFDSWDKLIDKDEVVWKLWWYSKTNEIFDYSDIKENNPYIKWIKWFVNNNEINSDNDITENIIKHFSEDTSIKDVNELFDKSENFRNFIDSLYAVEDTEKWIKFKNWKTYHWVSDEFKSFISKIISEKKVIVNKNDIATDISNELLENTLKDRWLFLSFKNIKNKSTYKEQLNKNWIWYYRNYKKESEKFSNEFDWELKEFSTDVNKLDNSDYKFDKIIQIDNMIKNNVDSIFFKIDDVWNFWYNNWFTYKSFNSMLNKYRKWILYNIQNIVKSEDEKIKLWNDYLDLDSPIEWSKFFQKIFNSWNNIYFEWKEWLYKDILSREKDKDIFGKILEWSELNDIYNKWYIFSWNFWDKDSVFHFYKSPEELSNFIKKEDRNKFSEFIYEYEYAFSNWFIIWDKFNNFESLKNYILKDLNKLDKWKVISFENFKKKIKSNEELFDWKWNSKVIESIKNIKKRESATMSNYSTFDEVKIPLNTLVLSEEYFVPEIFRKLHWKYDWNNLSKSDIKKFENDIDNLSQEDIDKILNSFYTDWTSQWIQSYLKDYYILWEEDKLKDAIKTWFYNDYEDWTSYVTSDIAILRWSIQWLWNKSQVKELFKEWKYNQFKDHFFGESKNNKRSLVKTLFNISDEILDESGKKLENTVLAWSSSLKLKWEYLEYSEPKFIKVNWKLRKVLWEIKNTDTSYFRNAATDLFEEKENQTVSDSIKSTLWYLYAMKINKEQEIRIEESYQRLLWDLISVEFKWDLYSTLDKKIWKIVSEYWIWYWSSSILNNKISTFLNEVNKIINKPKDIWQSVFIKKSDIRISPTEVIVSWKSNIVKTIREDVIEIFWKTDESFIWKKYNELSLDNKNKVDDNLYTVWFRYPVPSIYNAWWYRIKIAEKLPEEFLDEYKHIWENQVITNPISTYLKLEWDNDWDHVYFISAFPKWWRETSWHIIMKNILNLWEDANFFEEISKDKTILKNKFIVSDQVKKDSNIEWEISLIESRNSSLDAKKRIWVVSAMWRTFKNLSQMFDENFSKNDIKLVRTVYWEENWYINANQEEISFNDFRNIISNIDQNRKYNEEYTSLLQQTIDFWNSNRKDFWKDWYVDLIWKLLWLSKVEWKYINEDLW
jgi:hypothetical protein